MTPQDIEAIRNRLREFVTPEEGKQLRLKLNDYACKHYKPKHSVKERLAFLDRNEASFEVNGWQSQNRPYYYSLFSVVTQHVLADCMTEALDKAIDIEQSTNNK